MYRTLRALHKWIGLFACLFLTVIAFTGFLLAIKKRAEWLQPATRERYRRLLAQGWVDALRQERGL